MSTEDSQRLTAKRWQDCTDVYDFLDQIRLRPGMWVPGGSLLYLQSLLTGYRAALGVYGIAESFAFWPEGACPRCTASPKSSPGPTT
ncbi:hypothetical protein ACFV4T_31445 [Streptomyces sp. NPDC059755]|uniref:hypothetical protein n=1 Tax=Streptomyces sp. NPDC059755 TaxID=3346934 RepID=UPI00365A76D0